MQDIGRFTEASEQEIYSIPYAISLSRPQILLLSQLQQEANEIRESRTRFGIEEPFEDIFASCGSHYFNLQEGLGWNQRRLADVGRSLQGIFSVNGEHKRRSSNPLTRRRFNQMAIAGYSVPEENEEAALTALRTGKFEKEFLSDDLPVLQAIWHSSEDLRDMRGPRGSHLPPPRFSTKQIAQACGIDEAIVTESLYRLSGLIARTTQIFVYFSSNGYEDYARQSEQSMQLQKPLGMRRQRQTIELQRWFIPPAHRDVIHGLLKTYA